METEKTTNKAVWEPENCLQCNICAYVCPTGALRPVILSDGTDGTGSLPLRENSKLRYKLLVCADACTGCGLCVNECPAKGGALAMGEAPAATAPAAGFEAAVPGAVTVRGSQFIPTGISFPEACPGCAEAIYVKLLTQLFGGRIVLGGARGCPDVTGALTDSELATLIRQEDLTSTSPLALCREIYAAHEKLQGHIRQLYGPVGISARAWETETADAKKKAAIGGIIRSRCEKLAAANEHAEYVLQHTSMLQKLSVWVLCGDGNTTLTEPEMNELIQSGMDVNLLLFETGKASDGKAAEFGEAVRKAKSAYVAQIAVGADYKQTLLALGEADRYPGPAVIIACAPCTDGTVPPDKALGEMRGAVRAGAWKLLKFDPRTEEIPFAKREPQTECCPTFKKERERWSAVSRELKKHPMKEQPPARRIKNNDEVYTSYSPAEAIREAKRCLRCRERPCMKKGCPVHNRIPDFIEQVAKGEFEKAYRILSETTCLPAVCGRVCQQSKQCEGSCVRASKGQQVAIGNLERFVADMHRINGGERLAAADLSGQAVAVVGSGPSGIACAGGLAELGYRVTVYERAQTPGGVLTAGIPEFRLPKSVIRCEVEKLRQKGVRFLTGAECVSVADAAKLLESGEYAALYVSNGAGVPVKMNIPGENAPSVYTASEYLRKYNTERTVESASGCSLPASKKVAVVGGGNVAMDACRAAIRTGAEKVYVLYRRSESEMPADPAELEEAREEGVEFRFLTNPVRILSGSDGVRGIECTAMALGSPDASGRRSVKAVEGSDFILDVDCVVMALGTTFDRATAAYVSGMKLTEKGGILVGEDNATSVEGVFAGGDTVTGPASVIRAMAAGKAAAGSIHEYISGKIFNS